MNLRPYQQEFIKALWEEMKVSQTSLGVASTGSGKTVVFVKLVEKSAKAMAQFNRKFTALILVHKVDLVTQAVDKFSQFASDMETGMFCGSLNEKTLTKQITIASIDSIKKQTELFYNLVIVDEAHRFYSRASFYEFKKQLIAVNPKIRFVYFTATPYAKVGYIYGNEGDEVKKPCYQIGMNFLVENNFLVPIKFQSSEFSYETDKLKTSASGDFVERDIIKLTKDQDKTEAQVKNALWRLEGRKKVIWCCTCIEHAQDIEMVLLKNHQEKAVTIHSRMSIERQESYIHEFEHGQIRHIVSVVKLSEGTDIPAIDAIVCLRPTRSATLYVQMAGRGLRLYEGKNDCLFLDFGGVVQALGHPAKPYIKKKGARASKKQNAIVCPGCRTLNFPPIDLCTDCGYQFLKDERTIDRLASLGLIPYDPKKLNKLAVIDWSVHWHHKTKKGRLVVLVTYTTWRGKKTEYIAKGSKYDFEFRADWKKGRPSFITLDSNNKFVKGRVYE